MHPPPSAISRLAPSALAPYLPPRLGEYLRHEIFKRLAILFPGKIVYSDESIYSYLIVVIVKVKMSN